MRRGWPAPREGRARSPRGSLAAAQTQKPRLHRSRVSRESTNGDTPLALARARSGRADARASVLAAVPANSYSCLDCSLTTALRARRSPASATRSQQPSCDGCGGASGGAAPAEHKAVAARASTATPGCYNPMQQQAGVSRRVRASPLPTSRNTSRSRDWGGATKRALRLRGSACGIMARDPRVRACGEGHALARCRSFQGGLVQVRLKSAGPPVAGFQDGGEAPSALAESLGVAAPQAPSRDTGGIGETRRLRRPAQIARDRRRGENAPGGGRPC